METAFGVAGVVLSWALAGSQWWRARHTAAGVSVLAWSVFLAVNASWVAYGIGVANPYLVVNGVGAGAFNAALLWRIDHRRARTFAVVAVQTALAAAVGLAVGWPTVAAWTVLLAGVVRLPQLAELLRAPDVTGVSLASWVLASVNNVAWIVVGIQQGDRSLAVANVVLGLSSLAVVALTLRRRRPPVGA